MALLTLVARASDGLPLSASTVDDEVSSPAISCSEFPNNGHCAFVANITGSEVFCGVIHYSLPIGHEWESSCYYLIVLYCLNIPGTQIAMIISRLIVSVMSMLHYLKNDI